MEMKEAERTVIAKPIPSRPTCSTFRSLSELLADAINTVPANACSGTAITAIRPKTVRFRPVVNRIPVGLVSSQREKAGVAACHSSDKISKSDCKSTIVYKPLARHVSKTTVSSSENLGYSDIQPQQAGTVIEHTFKSNFSGDCHQNFPLQSETDKIVEPSKMSSENLEDNKKSLLLASNGDRLSYDGYNWRKYGQKQVKGSEYPRSYYKCTHPNCPVKKKVERSLDGQIAEIVYKGEHSHSKPQPPKCNTSGEDGKGFISDGTGQETDNKLWSHQLSERNEGSKGRLENQNEIGLPALSTFSGRAPLSCNHIAAGTVNAHLPTPENSCGLSVDFEERSKGLEAENSEPKSKRRKNGHQSHEAGISGESAQETQVMVQSYSDPLIIGDGFRWRKYGQKVVKGNPYPRSYYRCTNAKCNVRKYVERASDDPSDFLTTYEGKHNHDMPIKKPDSVGIRT